MNDIAEQASVVHTERENRQTRRRALLLGSMKAATYVAPATLVLLTMEARAAS